MVVERGDREAGCQQPAHDRIYLLMRQHEVTHDHYLVAHGVERRPGAEGERRLDCHTVELNVQITAGEAITANTIGLRRSGSAKALVHERPPVAVRLGRCRLRVCLGGGWRSERDRQREQQVTQCFSPRSQLVCRHGKRWRSVIVTPANRGRLAA